MRLLRRLTARARTALTAVTLLAAFTSACTRTTVEPVEGLSHAQLTEIAREAYPLWDPAGIELRSMALLRGAPVAADRYELVIRYTVRKAKPDEPIAIDAWAARRRARAQRALDAAGPEVSAAFDRQEATTVASAKRVAAMALNSEATFEDTLVLLRRNGQWVPQAWVDNGLVDDALRPAPRPL